MGCALSTDWLKYDWLEVISTGKLTNNMGLSDHAGSPIAQYLRVRPIAKKPYQPWNLFSGDIVGFFYPLNRLVEGKTCPIFQWKSMVSG